MNLVFVAAFLAACSAAKLDRTYLPPTSSQSAGGGGFESFNTKDVNAPNPGLQAPFQRTSDDNVSRGKPSGSYENEHEGVVVDAAAPGTRASNQPSGLGAPRVNYGSTDSKVGAAAFRGTKNQATSVTSENGQFNTIQGQTNELPVEPDLSAFYQKPSSSFKPEIQVLNDRGSNTLQYYNNIGLNKFDYGYETENGIKSAERGVSINGVMTQGSYSYKGDDGKVYSVVYTADRDGFRPTGSHLPTPPPIPAEIIEALQQNAKDEANGIYDDGSYDVQKYNAQDNYAQSDANGNYNDRQSNKFGGRPGFDAGGSTFINQAQQSFARPNAQGQLSSYDSTKESSVTKPDSTKLLTDVTQFDVTKQSNRFGERPTSDVSMSGSFTNQDKQDIERPNVQGQFNSYFPKDSTSTQHDTSKFGTGNTSNQGNSFTQNGLDTQVNNRFGSTFQYLPPNEDNQDLKTFEKTDSSKNNNFNHAQRVSEQKSQEPAYNGKPVTIQMEPSSYGPSMSAQGSTKNPLTSFGQISNSYGTNIGAQNNPLFQTGIQNSISSDLNVQYSPNSNRSLSISEPPEIIINNSPDTRAPFQQTGLQSSLIGSDINFGVSASPQSLSNNPKNQGSALQTVNKQSPGDIAYENTNPDSGNKYITTLSLQALPTKQPQLTLTTPLDPQEQQTNRAPSELSTSFIGSQTQMPYSINVGNSQTLLTNNQKLNDDHSSNKFLGESQVPDNSYIYNKPSNPFKTPSATDLHKTPDVLFSQFNSATRPSGFTKYSQPPTLASFTQNLTTFTEDEIKKNTFQTNGITKATISSFPSITPTFSSQTHSGEVYEYTKPALGLSQEDTRESTNSEMIKQSSLPSLLKKDSIKPQISVNTQFGQQLPTPSTTAFGQKTTPFSFNIQTGSTFGQKSQQTSSFGQQPTASPFDSQTILSLGQNPTQQEFGSQSSFSFGQPTTQSRFDAQTSTSLNKQITPTIDQTSLSFNQKPTLSPLDEQKSTFDEEIKLSRFDVKTSSSFNQQTSPSPAGIQSSSSIGTPSRIGVQTTSTFGQQPTQLAEQTGISFGSHTTPSRFGDQFSGESNFSFGSRTSPSSFGSETSTTFNEHSTPSSLNTPSRFINQASSTFGQKPIQSQPGEQTSVLFGSRTTPTRFEVPTSTSFRQQTTPARFGLQSSLSTAQQTTPLPFSIQSHSESQPSLTFGQNHAHSLLGGQTSVSFASQSTSPRFGAPITTLFGQRTTTSRFGIPSSSSTAQQTTPPHLSEQTGTLFGQKTTPFNVQTGSSSGQQTSPSHFGVQTSSFATQQTTSPFREQSSSEFGKPTTQAQYDYSSSEQRLTTQFGNEQEQNKKSNEQFVTQSDLKPSSLQTTTLLSKESIETNSADKIHEYNTPTTSIAINDGSHSQFHYGSQQQSQANSQLGQQNIGLIKENDVILGQLFSGNQAQQFNIKPTNQVSLQTEFTSPRNELPLNQQSQGAQSDQQPIAQSVEENFSTSTQNEGSIQPNQQYQTTIPPRFQHEQKVTNLPFASQTTTQSVALTSEQSSDLKKQNTFQLSSTNPDNTQMGSRNTQSSFNLQRQQQSQNSQSGAVYQYEKPSQSFPVFSQIENNRFGPNKQKDSIEQPGHNKFDITKPITSHLSQSSGNLNNIQTPTQIPDASQSQSDDKLKPEFSFYSACCQGFKTQNSQGLQSFSGKVPADTRFGSNNIGLNKNEQLSNGSGQQENKFGIIASGSGIQDFGPQKETSSFIGEKEEFGGPRNPPRFDETGYHY